jgi:hypothetical protein
MPRLAGGHFPEVFTDDVKWETVFIGGSGIKVLIHEVDKLAGGVTDICAAVSDTAWDEQKPRNTSAEEKAHLCVESWAFSAGIHEANQKSLGWGHKPDIILIVVNVKCLDSPWLDDGP